MNDIHSHAMFKDGEIVYTDDLLEWARWFETADETLVQIFES